MQSAIAIVPRDGVDAGHASTIGVNWHGRQGIAGLWIGLANRDIWPLFDLKRLSDMLRQSAGDCSSCVAGTSYANACSIHASYA